MSIALSIVIHGHRQLLVDLLIDLQRHASSLDEVWITANTPSDEIFLSELSKRFDFNIIVNSTPKGFGANHNAAFLRTTAQYFVVCNPDIRFNENPFPKLIEFLELDSRPQIVSPRIVGLTGDPEDHTREFLNTKGLIYRIIQRCGLRISTSASSTRSSQSKPDWLGGMLHVYRSNDFEKIGGFDEGYFLYAEDMDICWRLREVGGVCRVIDSAPHVVHAAQRMSRRSIRHIRWHLAGLFRFWLRVTLAKTGLHLLKAHTIASTRSTKYHITSR